MKTVTAVLAVACAAALSDPAHATGFLGGLRVTTPQQQMNDIAQASQARALQAATSGDDFCGESAEPPCRGTGCATDFEEGPDGLCMFAGADAAYELEHDYADVYDGPHDDSLEAANSGRAMLQSFRIPRVSGFSRSGASARGKGGGRRRGGVGKRRNGGRIGGRIGGRNGGRKGKRSSKSIFSRFRLRSKGKRSSAGSKVVVKAKGSGTYVTSSSYGFTGTFPHHSGPTGMYGGPPPIHDPPHSGPPGMYGGLPHIIDPPPPPPPVVNPAAPKCSGTCAKNGHACAGRAIQGVRACCDPSHQCVKFNSFYSQCRPKGLNFYNSAVNTVQTCTV